LANRSDAIQVGTRGESRPASGLLLLVCLRSGTNLTRPRHRNDLAAFIRSIVNPPNQLSEPTLASGTSPARQEPRHR
jgi:hypothetical protein